MNKGRENEYLSVKQTGKTRAVNLREPELCRAFFEMPEADRALQLGAAHRETTASRMRPAQTEAQYQATVDEWVQRRSLEVRYLNSSSKVYKNTMLQRKKRRPKYWPFTNTALKSSAFMWRKSMTKTTGSVDAPVSQADLPRKSLPANASLSSGPTEKLEAWEMIANPVLLSVPSDRRPDSEIVCTICPKATWMLNNQVLHCWCKLMHTMTWQDGDSSLRITACNGPEEGQEA
ncbi:MAG: hypothetical protein NVSMB6_01800 [Burkholderiaceae bacterium]